MSKSLCFDKPNINGGIDRVCFQPKDDITPKTKAKLCTLKQNRTNFKCKRPMSLKYLTKRKKDQWINSIMSRYGGLQISELTKNDNILEGNFLWATQKIFHSKTIREKISGIESLASLVSTPSTKVKSYGRGRKKRITMVTVKLNETMAYRATEILRKASESNSPLVKLATLDALSLIAQSREDQAGTNAIELIANFPHENLERWKKKIKIARDVSNSDLHAGIFNNIESMSKNGMDKHVDEFLGSIVLFLQRSGPLDELSTEALLSALCSLLDYPEYSYAAMLRIDDVFNKAIKDEVSPTLLHNLRNVVVKSIISGKASFNNYEPYLEDSVSYLAVLGNKTAVKALIKYANIAIESNSKRSHLTVKFIVRDLKTLRSNGDIFGPISKELDQIITTYLNEIGALVVVRNEKAEEEQRLIQEESRRRTSSSGCSVRTVGPPPSGGFIDSLQKRGAEFGDLLYDWINN